MLRVSRGMAPGVMREDEHAGIWIWSDLHLGHTETLHAFGRPFETAAGMDDKIFWNWRRVVAPEDTILILGDVTVHPLWGPTAQAGAPSAGTEDSGVREPRDHPGRLGGQRWVRRGLQHVVRGRRSAVAADARPTASRPGGLRERSRPSPPGPGAGRDATHQRLRRAAPLPAAGPDGGPGARPATRPRRHRERPHDGPPAGSGALTDAPQPVVTPVPLRGRRRRRPLGPFERALVVRLLLPSPVVHRVVDDEELLEARPTSCLQSSTAILGRAAVSRRRRDLSRLRRTPPAASCPTPHRAARLASTQAHCLTPRRSQARGGPARRVSFGPSRRQAPQAADSGSA